MTLCLNYCQLFDDYMCLWLLDKMVQKMVYGQNGTDKMVYGQNGMDKMVRTKWYRQNGTDKMVYGQNGMGKMVYGQNGILDKMVYGQNGRNFLYGFNSIEFNLY